MTTDFTKEINCYINSPPKTASAQYSQDVLTLIRLLFTCRQQLTKLYTTQKFFDD